LFLLIHVQNLLLIHVQNLLFSGSQGPFLGTWLRQKYGGGTTAKTTTWEAGHREPTVVVWPGVMEPNTTSDALTSALDIFPTVLSAAGASLPKMRHYDGIDLTSFFRGETKEAHYVSGNCCQG